MADKLEELSERWLEEWIDGIAWFIARGPKGEPTEETIKEYREIKKLLEEKKGELKEKAEKWKKRLMEALGI